MKVEKIPVRELIDECLEVKGILAERYGISLEAELDDNGASLRGDRGLLRAALNNMIDYSIRHNRQGGKMTITYRSDGTRESMIVSDTGKSIPYDELCCIRDLFSRAGKPGMDESERYQAGLIGMTIVRDVADLHGGRVAIRSLEGEGTTYSFHLPRCG